MPVLAATALEEQAAGVQRTVIVVFPGVQQLDVTGPFEVLRAAGQGVVLASPTGQAVRSSSGLELGVHRRLADVRGPLHTLLVAGGQGVENASRDVRLLHDIRRLAARSDRVASVCSGAFLLAGAGLLDGRRATTHWQRIPQFAGRSRRSPSRTGRSSCATARCGPRPGSPPGWTWRWRSSPRTAARTSPSASLATS